MVGRTGSEEDERGFEVRSFGTVLLSHLSGPDTRCVLAPDTGYSARTKGRTRAGQTEKTLRNSGIRAGRRAGQEPDEWVGVGQKGGCLSGALSGADRGAIVDFAKLFRSRRPTEAS